MGVIGLSINTMTPTVSSDGGTYRNNIIQTSFKMDYGALFNRNLHFLVLFLRIFYANERKR